MPSVPEGPGVAVLEKVRASSFGETPKLSAFAVIYPEFLDLGVVREPHSVVGGNGARRYFPGNMGGTQITKGPQETMG